MGKIIIYKKKSKKAEKANLMFVGILLVLGLFIGFAIFNYTKETIGSIWSSISTKFKSYQPDKYEYTPDQYVDEEVRANVYAYIYLAGNADRKVTTVTDFNVGLGSTFANFKNLVSSGCNPGSEFPGSLSRSGCYILAAEDDTWFGGGGDDCAANLYMPYNNGLILYNTPALVPEDKKEAKIELKKDCITGYGCQQDALNLLYHFYAQADEGVLTKSYFDKSLVCASPRLGVYMWFKCDSAFADKAPDNKIEIYGERDKIQYQCLCSSGSCTWSLFEEKV